MRFNFFPVVRHPRTARFGCCLLRTALMLVIWSLCCTCARAATFTVTNTNNSGLGSLRQEILNANSSPGSTIRFFITTSSVAVIKPTSVLPPLTGDGTILDGTSQTTLKGNTNPNGPEVEIDGSVAPEGVSGLVIEAANCLVRGLIINGFHGADDTIISYIIINGGSSSGNMVQGCYIGANSAASAAKGHAHGITIQGGADNNVIGGTTTATRNIICGGIFTTGNFFEAVRILGFGTNGNKLRGNYINLNRTGTATIPTSADGVRMAEGAQNNAVGGAPSVRNVIAGSTAVKITGLGTNSNLVQSNYIGLNAAGTAAVDYRDGTGVKIADGAQSNRVGGTTAGDGNVISNFNDGILLTDANTAYNVVQGNLIGTNAAGTSAVPSETGIRIKAGAHHNTIGGTTAAARNVIAGNTGDGIYILDSENGGNDTNTDNNLVYGNYIGLNKNGSALGNGGFGIVIWLFPNGNRIGTTTPGGGNTIAFNGKAGVFVTSIICGAIVGCFASPTNHNPIRGNSIYSNGGLGIDLGFADPPTGPTPNDVGDADVFSNELQNYPVLTHAVAVSGNTAIKGTLNSIANSDFDIDLFLGTVRDPSGYGEGQYYRGTVAVHTDANGNATFVYNLSGDFRNYYVTATATRKSRSTSITTSEFSVARKALPPTLSVGVRPASFVEDAGARASRATVTRNTVDNSTAVDVTLSSSDTSEATVPAVVTIPAGAASVSFWIAAVDDRVQDGPRPAVITASASGFVSGSASVRVMDDGSRLKLSITPSSFSETAGANAATGTVARTTSTAASMTVRLTSSKPGEAKVPSSVIIPAGEASTTFAVEAVDDTLADGAQSVTITASQINLVPASQTLTVTDNEVKTLTVSVTPETVSESAGANAATGTVTRNTSTTSEQIVTLSSSAPDQAVPATATVTIPVGQTSATFKVNTVPDDIVDGSQSVVFIASASGFTSGTDTVTVTDDDTPSLTLTVSPNSFSEGAGSSAATGTVTRNTDTSADLIVTLNSSDPSEATVPATVTIPAGAASKTFAVTAVNDTLVDGSQSVVLSASATGFTSGTAIVTVTDNETAAPDSTRLAASTIGFSSGIGTE